LAEMVLRSALLRMPSMMGTYWLMSAWGRVSGRSACLDLLGMSYPTEALPFCRGGTDWRWRASSQESQGRQISRATAEPASDSIRRDTKKEGMWHAGRDKAGDAGRDKQLCLGGGPAPEASGEQARRQERWTMCGRRESQCRRERSGGGRRRRRAPGRLAWRGGRAGGRRWQQLAGAGAERDV
jgi:hypothetical protein